MAEAERPRKIQKIVCEDGISSLSDDFLIQILLCVPTKDAVATMILSKRWLFVWTKLPRLDYQETKNSETESKSVWWFLDQSMRLYNARTLESLCIQLGPQCPVDVDVDVVNWVAKAVDRRVRRLGFELLWQSEPIRFPKILYTCKTLASLTLSSKILVDVPTPVYLPSLKKLNLLSVVYKDEDSHVRRLSGCPVLKYLNVIRVDGVDDNVRKFSVEVPSLLKLTYKNDKDEDEEEDEDDTDVSLVIDTPALVFLDINDTTRQSCSIEYMPHLDKAYISVEFYPNGNFLRSLSEIEYLDLIPGNTMVSWYNTVNFSRLIACYIVLDGTDLCESLVVLLSNCPKLTLFMVECNAEIDQENDQEIDQENDQEINQENDQEIIDQEISDHVPHLWTHSVPKCLSSTLEIFVWEGYEGRENEKELIRYILDNSKCLKTASVHRSSTFSTSEETKKMLELYSMHTVLRDDEGWYDR